jgi:hypothetical protein
MTTTSSTPSNNQVGKLEERLRASARKAGITEDHFQAALGFPGTGLENEIAAIIRKYANKVRGIVNAYPAVLTGLIPHGWSVNTKNAVPQDLPEVETELANVDYVCPLKQGDSSYIDYDTMMQRAIELDAIGSLGYAFQLLEAQKQGKEIFPVASRGKHHFIMPRTELFVSNGHRNVAYFFWGSGSEEWICAFLWDGSRFDRNARFLVPREKKPLAV